MAVRIVLSVGLKARCSSCCDRPAVYRRPLHTRSWTEDSHEQPIRKASFQSHPPGFTFAC